MTIKVSEVLDGEYVVQCNGTPFVDGVRGRCRAILTFTMDDTFVEYDRGIDYRMLQCPVCRARQEV